MLIYRFIVVWPSVESLFSITPLPSLRYDYPLIPLNRASDQSGTRKDDAMSIDQLETTNDYDQIW